MGNIYSHLLFNIFIAYFVTVTILSKYRIHGTTIAYMELVVYWGSNRQ